MRSGLPHVILRPKQAHIFASGFPHEISVASHGMQEITLRAGRIEPGDAIRAMLLYLQYQDISENNGQWYETCRLARLLIQKSINRTTPSPRSGTYSTPPSNKPSTKARKTFGRHGTEKTPSPTRRCPPRKSTPADGSLLPSQPRSTSKRKSGISPSTGCKTTARHRACT